MKWRLGAVLGLVCAAPVLAADLTVTVTGLPDDRGVVQAALYDSSASFGKYGAAVSTVSVAPNHGAARFTIGRLRPGRYALMVFHDATGSGRLETNFLGIPTEAYGFSNGARGRFGPPGFDQASFEVPEPGLAVSVRLQ